MKTQILLASLAGFTVCFCLLGGTAVKAEEKVSLTDRVTIDEHCLTVDGKDLFVFSGAFHYFRCPKELWRDRFQKIKDAGFNTVETYVAWNWHEREKPAYLKDFSKIDLTDIKDWLHMAHEEFGLYTIVRPGPYICAEWEAGGFPRWLLTLRPKEIKHKVWLRSDDPVFLEWSKHWYDAVCPVLAAEQISRKPQGRPGTILFQIENEYDYCKSVPEDAKVTHLKALYQNARENGIVVPIFTCWTREVRNQKDPLFHGMFDSSNFYHRRDLKDTVKAMDELKKAQPQIPGMVAELQGGWFSDVGRELSENQQGIDARQINAITLTSILHGGTILNYYMLFGGTNLDSWAARNITTTYDYNAPIREWGGVGDKYAAVREIGKMIQQYGPALARSSLIKCTVEGADPEVEIALRRGPQDESFVFCRNTAERVSKYGMAILRPELGEPINVVYDLGPFDFQVCYLPTGKTDTTQGHWMPEPPAAPPHSVRIAQAWKKTDPEASQWLPVKENTSLPAMGILDARFVLYRSQFDMTPEQIRKFGILDLELFASDDAVVRVNGQIITKAERNPATLLFKVAQHLRPGRNEIVFLHDDLGHDNGAESMENLSGLRKGLLIEVPPSLPLEDWRVKVVDDEKQGLKLAATKPDDSSWEHFLLDSNTLAELAGLIQPGAEGPRWPAAHILFSKKATAVFQTSIDLTEETIRSKCTKLIFDRIDDKGVILVNGEEVGKWEDWQKPFTADVVAKLKPGKNIIAVVLTNTEGEGGLTKAVRLSNVNLEGFDLNWELAPAWPAQRPSGRPETSPPKTGPALT